MSYFFVERNIAKARTLSKDFYTNLKFFEEAKEKIFSRSWQYAGDTSLLKEAGYCYPFTLLEGYLDQPLVLTENKLQQITCLSNVCTHRGNILATQPCKVNNLRCKYHGRLFDLSGKFLSMPEFREVRNFPTPNDDLHTLPLYKWGNWLFT